MADPNEQPDNEAKTLETESLEESPGEASAALKPDAPAEPRKKPKKAKPAEPESTLDRNRRIREEAAAKRRVKEREGDRRRVVTARNLETSEIVDDALARTTHAVSGWLKRNLNLVQWLVLLVVVGGISYQIYAYRHAKTLARATDDLARAVRTESARVDEASAAPDEVTGLVDNRLAFATDEARLKAAAEEYRKVQSGGSTTTSIFASLGLAGVLFDQKKYKAARAEYEKVKASTVAAKDRDVRGRAIEGVGLTLEAEGQIDSALTAFRELENTDIPGFGALGQYHQARLFLGKGERDRAKQLLTKAQEKLKASDESEKDSARAPGVGFLELQVREMLGSLDPNAIPKPSSGLTPEQMKRLQEQLKLEGAAGTPLDPKKLEELLGKLAASSSAPTAPPAPAPSGAAP